MYVCHANMYVMVFVCRRHVGSGDVESVRDPTISTEASAATTEVTPEAE